VNAQLLILTSHHIYKYFFLQASIYFKLIFVVVTGNFCTSTDADDPTLYQNLKKQSLLLALS